MSVASTSGLEINMWLPRRLERAARESRHLALRDYARDVGWSVVGLTTSFADLLPVQPHGLVSAQAELAVGGVVESWYVRSAVVAARLDNKRREEVTSLVTSLDFGPDPGAFVARRVGHDMQLTSEGLGEEVLAAVRAVLTDVDGLGPHDQAALLDGRVVLARRLRSAARNVPVSSSVALVVRLAQALETERA